jgi:hypothetical protein
MRFETYVGSLGVTCRIDHCKRTLAIADEHLLPLRIDPHIVRIVAELDASHGGEIIAAEHAHRAVAGVTTMPLGYWPVSSSQRTVRPVLVVVAEISSTITR